MAPKTASLRRAGVVDDLKFKWCQRCIRRLSVRRLPLARYSQLTRQSVQSDSEVGGDGSAGGILTENTGVLLLQAVRTLAEVQAQA
jgi:hypothetical protein